MDMFTLHEFIHEHCHNKSTELQTNQAILIQAIRENKLISRYSLLLQQKLDILQICLQDLDSVPGIPRQDEIGDIAEIRFIYILLYLLSGPDNKATNIELLTFFPTNTQIHANEFAFDVSKIPVENRYYYSNLYHIILAWFYDKYMLNHMDLYSFYYKYLIKEQSLVYQIYQKFADIDLVLWINYLEEHHVNIKINKAKIIDIRAANILSSGYVKTQVNYNKIRYNIYMQRNFYNFHSNVPYVLKIYDTEFKLRNWDMDYARFNYLSKLNLSARRCGLARKYQPITDATTFINIDYRELPKKLSIGTIINHILLANNGEIIVRGPVLGFLHIAQYGLLVDNNIVRLLLISIDKLHWHYAKLDIVVYSVLLLQMGFNMYLIRSLIPQQMWATVLTGIMPTWRELNLAFKQRVKYLNSTEYYYYNAVNRELVTKENIIANFNVKPYSDIVADFNSHIAGLYRYTFVNSLISNEMFELYPVLMDKRIMQNWLVDEYSELTDTNYPKLAYIDFTKSTAELAKQYDIANIYSRMLLLLLIAAKQQRVKDIYYRKSSNEIGDSIIYNTNSQPVIIDHNSVTKILDKSVIISDIELEDAVFINLITMVHALNLFNQSQNVVLYSTIWQFFIRSDDL